MSKISSRFEYNLKTSIDMETPFEKFVKGYVVTALWVEDIPLGVNEVPKNVYAKANKDCLVFYTKLVSRVGGKVAEQIISIEGHDTLSHAGHDFYLTRNGHGTGFWDRDEDFYFGHNELLTELSEQMKSDDEFVILGLEYSEEE